MPYNMAKGGLWITDRRSAGWPKNKAKTYWLESNQHMLYKSMHQHNLNIFQRCLYAHKYYGLEITFDVWTSICKVQNVEQRRKGTTHRNSSDVESCRDPLGLPSSHLEGFPEGSKVGFHPSPRMASESEGRAGTSVRTRAPTVRKPLRTSIIKPWSHPKGCWSSLTTSKRMSTRLHLEPCSTQALSMGATAERMVLVAWTAENNEAQASLQLMQNYHISQKLKDCGLYACSRYMVYLSG